MHRTFKDYSKDETLESNEHQLHRVIKARKKPLPRSHQHPEHDKFKFFHYLKHDDNAAYEVRGQEFFRLLYPAQPKTRLIKHKKKLVVDSKEVPGFTPFQQWGESQLHDDIKSGAVTGLGKILILSLITQEIDLKEQNLGVNNNRQLIKLDGGCCFWNQQFPRTNKKLHYFSSNDFKTLPYIADFEVYNWFDLYQFDSTLKATNKLTPKWLTPDMQQWVSIRSEINEITLAFLMMPDEFIHDFDKAYPQYEDNLVALRLIKARKSLQVAAMDDPRFVEYLLSPKALRDIERYIGQFETFCPKGKYTLPVHRYKHLFRMNADTLIKQAQRRPQTRRWHALRGACQAADLALEEKDSVKKQKKEASCRIS